MSRVIPGLGCVVIGRNEGERLAVCLDSLAAGPERLVYVDSGSSDGSPGLARARGVEVLELDPARPFSAARGRNEGLARLRELLPELRYVQFVDGDCEVDAAWLAAGVAALAADPQQACVFGRGRERFPGASIYNRLADIEWSHVPGPAESCGGVAMYRAAALAEVGGFDEELIAGEEPELCLRLRRAGHGVLGLDAEMMRHDLAMFRFGAWWKRIRRGGYAAALGAQKWGAPPERFCVGRQRRMLFWGGVAPLVAVGSAFVRPWFPLLVLAAYAKPFHGAFRGARARGQAAGHALLYAGMLTIGKFAECQGVLACWWNSRSGRGHRIIEHRQPVDRGMPTEPETKRQDPRADR